MDQVCIQEFFEGGGVVEISKVGNVSFDPETTTTPEYAHVMDVISE